MESNTPKSLDQIKDNSKILNLDKKNVLELARVSSISQLLSISKGENIKGINNNKVINSDTIEIANFVIEKIKTILDEDINYLKNSRIENVVTKIGNNLIKSSDIEDFLVGTYIQKISYEISNIHLRYERKKSYLDRKELSKNNEQLVHESNTDTLTGLLNRRGIISYLNDAIEEKDRDGSNYSVILIDIDFFKKINDKYGHNVGDIALKEISSILKSNMRMYDKICRWGGEEFLILMKGKNNKKAELLRKEIENGLKEQIDLKINSERLSFQVTASIGITAIEENDDIISITKRADIGLYKVKNAGRNGVVKVKKITNNENKYEYNIKGLALSVDNNVEYHI